MEDLLIKLVVFVCLLTLMAAETYYVTPLSKNSSYEENVPCFTLSQYAMKTSSYFASNSTLILLPGNHSLDLELSIQNITFLSIVQYSFISETVYISDTFITCHQSARFMFVNINIVSIRGLTFLGCMNTNVTFVKEFEMEDCSLHGQGSNGTGLDLYMVRSVVITRSSFSSNTGSKVWDPFFDEGGSPVGGAMITIKCNVTISNSTFSNNAASGWGGAVYAKITPITFHSCTFNNNSATDNGNGGAVYSKLGPVTVIDSTFINNTVIGAGGAIFTMFCYVSINNSEFYNNTAGAGGAVVAIASPLKISSSTFEYNTATEKFDSIGGGGGAVYIAGTRGTCSFTINHSTFYYNIVTGDSGAGGVMYVKFCPTTINNSVFNRNSVTGNYGWGGAVYAEQNVFTIHNSKFNNNLATDKGGAFYLLFVTLNNTGVLEVQNNSADTGAIYAVQSTLYLFGNTTVSGNRGSLFVYSCNMTFVGQTDIENNLYSSNTSQEGGAVTGFQSEIFFTARTNLINNTALHGGGIAVTQSKVYMYDDITISHNTASVSGGGIYAYQSEINFKHSIYISSNSANDRGGGIHAISTTTRLTDDSNTFIVDNHATQGGGVYLEFNAKIYLLKTQPECKGNYYIYNCKARRSESSWIGLHLIGNTADYGGALYVADDTNAGTCFATPFSDKTTISSECFIQGLGLYQLHDLTIDPDSLNIVNTYFATNLATIAGSNVFGGQLDRCGTSPFAEIFHKYPNSSIVSTTSYFTNITDLNMQDFNSTKLISSDAVRVCFCRDNQPDCSYHPEPMNVKKGEMFTVSLVAVDHINNTVSNNTMHAFVSLEAKLGEGQSIQQTNEDGSCTDLAYSILSVHNYEKLHFYADGPCMSGGISTANLTVEISPCPIGFKDTNLRCECDPTIYPEYISNCSIDSETIERRDSVWFAYVNVNNSDHQGYILHKHCPFDYCRPPTEDVSVNLNIEDGSNVLCAFNRSGKLCGSCVDGLSLSLGSSHCRPCSNDWITLLCVFAIAGITLVAFLLEFNFTVAVGTFNGLIFYANIFAANCAIFFPSDETKLLTVFIAWLNLDFGFETCFYDGMDGYAKTWLQLAFPLYIISLVVAIIIISDYSSKFAALFTGKNPIATLATLILLSYTKLLRTIIASLSFTTLQYSDGSHELVWLFDANVPYLTGKHIPLFIIALVIVIASIMYTFLLFSWQWLVYCPNRGPLRWVIGNTKVIAFMDAYHNPYNKDHRYWIGLLLLVRVLLYLVSALNVLGDPRINLLSITLATAILLVFQHVVEMKYKIHKNKLNDVFEIASLLNLIALSSITFFITKDKTSQNVVAYISTGSALTTFLAIFVYHTYEFILKKQLQSFSSKYLHMLRGSRQRKQLTLELETAAHMVPDEESASETEFDGIPEPEYTNTELEQSVMSEDCGDIEPCEQETELQSDCLNNDILGVCSNVLASECNDQPTNNETTGLETVLASQTNLVKTNDMIHRKASSSFLTLNPRPNNIPIGNKTTPIKFKLPILASGQELTADLFQPSVFLEANREDEEPFSNLEDECTPLLL